MTTTGPRPTSQAESRVAPGPRGHPLLGIVPEFWRDPIRPFLDAWRDHGDVVRLRLGGPYIAHFVAHPDHVKHVLQDHHDRYPKVEFYNEKLKGLVGEGLLTSEGSVWLRQRRLMQPAFHRHRVAALGTVMTDSTVALLDGWRSPVDGSRPVDVAHEMMRLTLQIVARALFGTDVSADADQIGDAVTIGIEHTNRRSQSYVDPPLWLPLPALRRFRAARAVLDATVYRMIDERRRSPADEDNLLAMLLAARDADTGEAMSDQQVRDEVMTIFLAGHETTAVALAWTFYLLSRHPDVDRRLHAELDSVLGGRVPTVEDLPRLRYTLMVVEESMRLYPPAWVLTRAPTTDDVVGGYRIPAKTSVFLSPYVTHRHPAFWENPERFAPERSAGRHRYAYFPFGGGPRQCIGNTFALVEAQLILATIAQRYRLDLVPGQRIEPRPLITLRPSGPVLVTLARRDGARPIEPS